MKLCETIRQLRTWGLQGAINALLRKPWEWRIRRKLATNARIHTLKGTIPQRGITVIAPISGAFSLSKTMRDFVVKLNGSGIPHQVFDTNRADGKVGKEEYGRLVTPWSEFNILKYDHVVEMLSSPLPDGLPVKRCRIAFWEGEHGILEAFPYLKDSYSVIAMSDFNERYFRRAMPANVKVRKILYPLLTLPLGILDKAVARERFNIPQESFVVFYNFDIRADYRKNPLGALKAFATAFKDKSDCRLVLKINGSHENKTGMDSLSDAMKNLEIDNLVVVVTEYLSQLDLYSLTNACDVYLSLHKAEGFGLGIAEAMQLGKPIIATDYSSTTEFCKESTSIPIPFKLIPATGDSLFSLMRYCAEPDLVEAANALKQLHDDAKLRKRLGETARSFIEEHYSLSGFKSSIEDFLDS